MIPMSILEGMKGTEVKVRFRWKDGILTRTGTVTSVGSEYLCIQNDQHPGGLFIPISRVRDIMTVHNFLQDSGPGLQGKREVDKYGEN